MGPLPRSALLLLLAIAEAWPQMVLPAASPAPATVRTWKGDVPAAAVSIEPALKVNILVLGDGLSPEQLAAANQEVATLQASLRKRLAAVTPLAGEFYPALLTAIPQLGEAWSALQVIGAPPPLDKETEQYAAALLLRTALAAQVRLSFSNPAGKVPDALVHIAQLTGGGDILAPPEPLQLVSWTHPAPSKGFMLYAATAGDVSVPSLGFSEGAALPSVQSYSELRRRLDALAAGGDPEQSREHLRVALTINPRDVRALRAGADLYEKAGDWKTAGTWLEMLQEFEPGNAELLLRLGNVWYRAKDYEAAEKALLAARDRKVATPEVNEELARIRLAQGKGAAALPFLAASLAVDPSNQSLWFLRAETAAQAKDIPQAIDAYEKGMALGGDVGAQRIALIRLCMAANDKPRALAHVRAALPGLPPDLPARVAYAKLLEELGQPDDAIALWRKIVEADATYEDGWVRIARFEMDRNRVKETIDLCDAGLGALPASSRLYLLKAEALAKSNRTYEARHVITGAAVAHPDLELLRRAADLRDRAGDHAPEAYQSLVEALDKGKDRGPAYEQAVRRGFSVSVRDRDLERARWFALRDESLVRFLPSEKEKPDEGIMVPGGLAAVSFIAGGRLKVTADRFVEDMCRTSLQRSRSITDRQFDVWAAAVQDHFRRVREIEAMGKRDGQRVVVTINASGKQSRKQAAHVLGLLGWKLKAGDKGSLTIEPVMKGEKAKRQETSSALAVDEVGMQEAIESGKPYQIEIPYEWARVFPAEAIWKEAFFPKTSPNGGLAEILLTSPDLARLYVGLNSMDREAAQALTAEFPLSKLAKDYENLLYLYGSAFSVDTAKVHLPGGAAAEAVWTQMTGASPSKPGAFFRALLATDGGKLLSFYYTVAQLDAAHQRFFTRTPERTKRFYQLFTESPEQKAGSTHDSAFIDFMRDVPLDPEGNVRFPGTPDVWMVAKGQSNNAARTAKLMKKLAKTAAPDVEDEILIRLAKTNYQEAKVQRTELDNFLAVVRIDEHRTEPLDESETLLLAQQYARFDDFYPYFSIFTSLHKADFEKLFAVGAKLASIPGADGQFATGLFDSLVEMAALMNSEELFKLVLAEFTPPVEPGEYAAAAIRCLRRIAPATPAFRDAVLPPAAPVSFQFRGANLTVNAGELRRKAFNRVLEMQKITPVETLLAIDTAFKESKPADLEKLMAALQHVDIPKKMKVTGPMRDLLEADKPAGLSELVREYKQKLAKKKVNPKDLEKLHRETLAALLPQLTQAAAGLVYAVYTHPSDLMISDDPLLVRKHAYRAIKPAEAEKGAFTKVWFQISSEEAGSYFEGNFAGFASAVGYAVSSHVKAGGFSSQGVVAAQIASLRCSDWRRLDDRDLQLLGLSVRAGREWISESAADPKLYAALAEATSGMLPLTRRSRLLSGIRDRQWKTAWESVTLSDLYFLGRRLRGEYAAVRWPSPVLEELTRSTEDEHLEALGYLPFETLDYPRPLLAPLAPYEEFERYMMPARLSERTAEAKLHCAYLLDQAGIPARAMGALAEPLARAAIARLHMADLRDWRSAIEAWMAIDDDILEGVLTPE